MKIQQLKGYKSNFSLEDKTRIDAKTILKPMRQENANKLVFAHMKISSLRNKFKLLANQVKGNIDVLMNSEAKTDDSFLFGKFLIGGFSKRYKLDRDSLGGGILLYVREDTPSNLLEVETKPNKTSCKATSDQKIINILKGFINGLTSNTPPFASKTIF